MTFSLMPRSNVTGKPYYRQRTVRIAAAISWMVLSLMGCWPRTANSPTPPEFTSTRDLPSPKERVDGVLPSAEGGRSKTGPSAGRILGIQVLLFSAHTQDELDGEMRRIADTGANTVIVRVFHNKGDRFYSFAAPRAQAGVYFTTTHAPVVDDVLGPIIGAARRSNLSVWAWMTTRYAAWGDEADGLFAYDFRKKTILPVFGRDLFDDERVDDLVLLYKDLAAYDIDGILFQDDLVLRHNEGMGEGAQELYGGPIRPDSLYIAPYPSRDGTKYYAKGYTDEFWKWSRFKARRLAAVAGAIIDGVHEIRPDMPFAVNLSYESVILPEDALAWLSQDFAEFKEQGVDYFFIMAYHRQIMREKGLADLGAALRVLGEISSRAELIVGEPERVGIKLQIADWDTGAPIGSVELMRAASSLSGIGRISLVFVPFSGDAPLVEVGEIFRTARGKEK